MAEPIDPASLAKAVPPNRDGAQDAPVPSETPRHESARSSAGQPDGYDDDDADHEEDQAGTTEGAAAPAESGAKNTPWPRLARADDPPGRTFLAALPKPSGNTFQILTWVAMQVCGFGLLLGGYFLGQAWAPAQRQASDSPDPARIAEPAYRSQRAGSERALEAAERALKAERSRDLQGARAIYDDMLKRQAPLPGAEYRLALLSLHQGDYLETETHLNRSIRAGEAVADCYLFRASLAGMKGNYADASTQLAAAVRAQPFSAKFCFCWGESLRREGRLPEAVARLSQALDRPDSAAARELYLFKLRLAKVETGTDEIFDAELASRAAESAPSGEWLLLAAAQEIGRKHYVAAAERIKLAKGLLPPEIFSNYLQDYLFQVQRSRQELAIVLDVPPPAAAGSHDAPLQDPAAWTAAEADPAAWPPFPKAE